MENPLSSWVRRLQLRSDLSEEDCNLLLSIKAPVVAQSARWDLVRPGQRVDYACLVVEGFVARSERFAQGSRQSTAIFLPGDMCDLHSVAVPVAGWGITALTDVVICQVPHEKLLAAADASRAVAQALWRDTIVDASVLSKWVSVLSGLVAPKRLAHLCCELAIRCELAGLGSRASFPFPFTQEQLSELLGVSPMHVNRIGKDLRAAGLIEWSNRKVGVPDWSSLVRFAEFDDQYLLLPS